MIEYCQRNVDGATRRRLLERDGTREAACLGRCGRCYREPFLVIDGELRRGEHDRVLERAGVDAAPGRDDADTNRAATESTARGER